MFAFLKYLPLIGLFKDVECAFREEQGKDRPKWLTRRFIGAIVALAGAGLSIQFGVSIEQAELDKLVTNLDQLAALGVAGYGVVLSIYGFVAALIKRMKGDKCE